MASGRLFELSLLVLLGSTAFVINAAGPTAFLEVKMTPAARPVEASRAVNQLVQVQRRQAVRSVPRPAPPRGAPPTQRSSHVDPPPAPVLSAGEPPRTHRVRGPPSLPLVVA